jgi:hypothetical protein
MDQITRRAEAFAQARMLLADKVGALHDGIAALRKDHIPAIKRAVTKAAEAEAALRGLVEANPDLFARPKTQIFSGVKVGFAKGKGSISFDDPDAVVARIRKVMPEQADVLIKTVETPNKAAMGELSASELKRIGCSLTEAGEQVVVKPVDSEVDKLVTALLKGATEETES